MITKIGNVVVKEDGIEIYDFHFDSYDGSIPAPEWAQSQLGRAQENERKRQHEAAELELLRQFYVAWEALHAEPKKDKQAAAETLVSISHAIKAHRG